MDNNVKKRIEEIKQGMECQKNFICEEYNFNNLCKAEDIGMDSFLYCKENVRIGCAFRFQVTNRYICKCPLRLFIAKELES